MNKLEKILSEFENKLSKFQITITDKKQINYGIQFKINHLNNQELIRLYTNKKTGHRFDCSLVCNSYYSELLKSIINNETVKEKEFVENEPEILIGTDESGKGDYFGPLVVAAVYSNDKIKKDFLKIGVKDCKKLSDKATIELSMQIRKILKNKFSIEILEPSKYNILYNEFKKEKKNLNNLLAYAHANTIKKMFKKTKCKNILIDKFADKKVVLDELKGLDINVVMKYRAEENLTVAAASILSRAEFLKCLCNYSLKYNITFPKGATKNIIETAKIFIKTYGFNKLQNVAKIHFKTTKKLI